MRAEHKSKLYNNVMDAIEKIENMRYMWYIESNYSTERKAWVDIYPGYPGTMIALNVRHVQMKNKHNFYFSAEFYDFWDVSKNNKVLRSKAYPTVAELKAAIVALLNPLLAGKKYWSEHE